MLILSLESTEFSVSFYGCRILQILRLNILDAASHPDVYLSMNMCKQRKAGRRQRAIRRFACRLYPSHDPLARLNLAKNEVPEEEAVLDKPRHKDMN